MWKRNADCEVCQISQRQSRKSNEIYSRYPIHSSRAKVFIIDLIGDLISRCILLHDQTKDLTKLNPINNKQLCEREGN